MSSTDSMVFKYEHGDRFQLTTTHKMVRWLFLVAALWCLAFFRNGAVAVVWTICFVIAEGLVRPKKSICISPRFLICGATIAYYGSIRKMILRPESGELALFWADNKSLEILRERFPTNARKPEKIAVNKASKFHRVSTKIIDKVLDASPNVELVGIVRSRDLTTRPGAGRSNPK